MRVKNSKVLQNWLLLIGAALGVYLLNVGCQGWTVYEAKTGDFFEDRLHPSDYTRTGCALKGNDCLDMELSSYYYCWDSGVPSPHHKGHPVEGDHPCTKVDINDWRNVWVPFVWMK